VPVPAAVATAPVQEAMVAKTVAAPDEATPTIGEAPAEDRPNADIDEVAESAFRAEAAARGESVRAAPAVADVAEATDGTPLPKLDDLVKRIPADVRETLDELFRAKFITVKRVPKSALKT
jgi:hypothetical protein